MQYHVTEVDAGGKDTGWLLVQEAKSEWE